MSGNDVIDQQLQTIQILGGSEVLKGADADMASRDPD